MGNKKFSRNMRLRSKKESKLVFDFDVNNKRVYCGDNENLTFSSRRKFLEYVINAHCCDVLECGECSQSFGDPVNLYNHQIEMHGYRYCYASDVAYDPKVLDREDGEEDEGPVEVEK